MERWKDGKIEKMEKTEKIDKIDMIDKIDKLERLACLYLTFLNNPRGISFSRIKNVMPYAYIGDPETIRRKFERDKEELKKLGMELRYIPSAKGARGSSSVEDRFYLPAETIESLPDIEMSSDEQQSLAALLLRGMADPQRDQQENDLLRSIASRLFYKNPVYLELRSFDRPPSPSSEKKREAAEDTLSTIHTALLKRRIITIHYVASSGKESNRTLSGRGLISHRGRWCLIAYCHDSQAIRSFYVDRIGSCKVTARSYAPDRHFHIKDWSLHPFALQIHPPRPVCLQLNPDYEENFVSHIASLSKLLKLQQNGLQLQFETTNAAALFSWMVSYPQAIEQLGPQELLEDFQNHLEAMKELYRYALK